MMTVDGVFVRLGATVQHATKKQLKEMIIDSSEFHLKKTLALIKN